MKSYTSVLFKALFLVSAILTAFFSITSEAADATTKNRIFALDSFWYQPIPTAAPLHSNSSNYVKEFLRQKITYYGTVNINVTSYASPVFYSNWYTKKVNVTEWDCQGKGFKSAELKEQWTNVPVPTWAIPAKGTDSEMTVYDAGTDTLWEFWRMRKNTAGNWEACWGGRLQSARSNPGAFKTFWGTTATSLPFIGGQITAEELAAGEIKHAIGISMVDIEKHTIFSWPAQRSDGFNPLNLPNRIPEGARFRLDPSINVDALPMSKAGKTIAKAAQTYGFVVWDRAGALSLRVQNSYSYTQLGKTNPYPALFENKPSYAVLNGFPWDKLQFLPLNYKVQ